MGTVVLAAEWRLGQAIHKPRLMVALGGDAGAAVMRPGCITWRKAFFPMTGGMGRRIGIEVRGAPGRRSAPLFRRRRAPEAPPSAAAS